MVQICTQMTSCYYIITLFQKKSYMEYTSVLRPTRVQLKLIKLSYFKYINKDSHVHSTR